MNKRVLFQVPLPPPITGQSLANAALLGALEAADGVDVRVVDTMKGHHRQGFTSLRHALRTLSFARQARRHSRWADVAYMNPSQTLAGNTKDLMTLRAMGSGIDKVVWHLHGGGIRRTVYDRSAWRHRINARVLSRMRRVIVEGDSLRTQFDGMVAPERIAVVHNFAADALFVDPATVADKHAASDVLEVLFLSNLFASKGYREVLGCAERAAAAGDKRLRFRFAGAFVETDAGVDRARIERLANAEYLGVIDGEAKRAALARAHVLCLPTGYPYEGQPLCILEAYASGLAVITTDQGGIRDVFTDGVHGWRVTPGSTDAVEAALRAAAADRGRCAAIGCSNRAAAEAYREARFLAGMLDVLLA